MDFSESPKKRKHIGIQKKKIKFELLNAVKFEKKNLKIGNKLANSSESNLLQQSSLGQQSMEKFPKISSQVSDYKILQKFTFSSNCTPLKQILYKEETKELKREQSEKLETSFKHKQSSSPLPPIQNNSFNQNSPANNKIKPVKKVKMQKLQKLVLREQEA